MRSGLQNPFKICPFCGCTTLLPYNGQWNIQSVMRSDGGKTCCCAVLLVQLAYFCLSPHSTAIANAMNRRVERVSDMWYNTRTAGFKSGSIPCTLSAISLLICFMAYRFSEANIAAGTQKQRHNRQYLRKLSVVSLCAEFQKTVSARYRVKNFFKYGKIIFAISSRG